MTTSKTPIRCKHVVDDKIIHRKGNLNTWELKSLDTEMLREK